MSALSIYLVMQQMEAVIFRFLILSVPVWLVWRNVFRKQNALVPKFQTYQIVDAGTSRGMLHFLTESIPSGSR
jgi:hypothetical protein